MANSTSKSRNQVPPTQVPLTGRRPSPAHGPTEDVDPVWLLKAIGLTILAALVCGYISVCLLFYQGQWQLVLHPSRTTPAPQTIAGTAFETVRFAVDESGTPQLTGWWIPSDPAGKYAAYTILYLPSGDGSLAAATTDLAAIHTLGINIFAFDYRGYGQSAPTRPNQARMTEDAASAWKYLTVSRAIPPLNLIPFGVGVGGALAAGLAEQHRELPVIIVDGPRPDLLQIVLADPRTKMLPVRALFHDRFDLERLLDSLKTPKLLLLTGTAPAAGTQSIQSVAASASDPKMISVVTPADRNSAIYLQQIARFLDQYLR